MKIVTVQFDIKKGGTAVVRATVKLVGPGVEVTGQTSSAGLVTFPAKDLAGKTVEMFVNNQSVKKNVVIPTDHVNATPRATIDIAGGTPAGEHHDVTAHAPAGEHHDVTAHAPAGEHHDPEGGGHEKDGHLITVKTHALDPIEGAVIRVAGASEVHVTDEFGEATVPFFSKPTRLEISAPRYKTQTVLIHPDENEYPVRMEADVKKAKPVSNTKSMLIVLATLLIAVAGYFIATGKSQVAQQTLIAHTTDAKSMIIVGCLIFTFLGIMNRIKNDQIPDVVFAGLALVAWIFAPQITSDFWRGLLSGGLLLVAYAFAISNTPDLTIIAVFWKLAAAGVYFFHWRGLIGADVVADELMLFKTLWLIGDAHLVLEVMQVAQRIKGHQMQETMENISFTLITVVAYAVARYWLGWQAYIALFVSGAIMGLIGELAEERFKNFDESQINTGRTFFDLALKGLAKYAKTQKADGAAVGVSAIVDGAIFLGIS